MRLFAVFVVCVGALSACAGETISACNERVAEEVKGEASSFDSPYDVHNQILRQQLEECRSTVEFEGVRRIH